MGERVNDSQVADLLALVRTDASVDTKVREITIVKSGIKQNNVPDSCVQNLFEIGRITMSSPQAPIVNAGFTTLSHLITRLSRQEPKHLLREAARTLPYIIDKVGDLKDSYRQLAAKCLTTFWLTAPVDVERAVKTTGLIGKSSRAKEACMNWLVMMHHDHGLQFKTFVPTLMELLEDADGMVRDVARNTVIILFENAPPAAKSDLKKQLKIFNVRPAIVTAITSHLGQGGPHGDAEASAYEPEVRNQFASSASSQASVIRLPTPPAEPKSEHVDPAYVNTQRELEDAFRDMHPFFEGKESEQNWLKREQSCTKLRKLNAGNAHDDFPEAWFLGIKGLLDGILKAVNSLRTSLSKEGCHVVQELTKTAGPGMDSMVEILLQNLIKLCGGTKKIASQAGDATVDLIISKVTFSVRITQHIWLAVQDKNVQPRTYAAGWLKTLLKKEAHHKNHVEHSGGLEVIEKTIKKGLADANAGVREKMRGTYWTFASIWPAKAEAIMATLDATQQKLLEKDPNNPNAPKTVEAALVRPGMGFSKSTMGPPKPSLRETLLAQKKAAMAAKNLPPRPGSAMSSFSPLKVAPGSSTISNTNGGLHSSDSTKSRAEAASSSHKGLSVAPMRPTKFRPRPEIARPATAGPYSVRRIGATASSEVAIVSPSTTRAKSNTVNMAAPPDSPRRTIGRPNTSHSSHSSHSVHVSPDRTKAPASKLPTSPVHKSPARSITSNHVASPAVDHEEFTMVMPIIPSFQEATSSSPPPVLTPAKSLMVYEDPFSRNDDLTTPRPVLSVPVLEEVRLNEDISLTRLELDQTQPAKTSPVSPERLKQNSRLLDSGINKIKAKTLDAHGFRKIQSMIRDNRFVWTDNKFDIMLDGIFEYLEAPFSSLASEKVQDVKTQMMSTIRALYKKNREAFRPHVAKGLQSLLATRSSYDSRAHIVSGLEALANDLVLIADPTTTSDAIISQLRAEQFTVEGCRTMSMGMHVLKELLRTATSFTPTTSEVAGMVQIATRCLESDESGVRMNATQLCVALHAKIGEQAFWEAMGSIREDPKSLITYYIVKHQREAARV